MKRFKNYYLSEAYTVIPKSEGEIDILKIAMDKEKLKDLFKYIVAKTNMPDPIGCTGTGESFNLLRFLYSAPAI